MYKLKNRISCPQLFYMVFFYVLSGLILYSGGSVTVTLFSGLFLSCVCVICASMRRDTNSFTSLLQGIFGKYSCVIRVISVVITVFPLVQTLYFVSFRASTFYDSVPSALIISVLVALCIFALSGGISSAARFSEICVLPLFAVLPLSLLGGGGQSMDISFFDTDLFNSFAVIGSVPVFISLYLMTSEEKEMSRYAKSSSFHPSTLLCGISGVVFALCVYMFLRFSGAESILSFFFICFFFFSRMLTIAISVSDIMGIREGLNSRECVRKIALISCVVVAVFPLCVYYGRLSAEIVTVCNVIFPCVIFASLMLKNSYFAQK